MGYLREIGVNKKGWCEKRVPRVSTSPFSAATALGRRPTDDAPQVREVDTPNQRELARATSNRPTRCDCGTIHLLSALLKTAYNGDNACSLHHARLKHAVHALLRADTTAALICMCLLRNRVHHTLTIT